MTDENQVEDQDVELHDEVENENEIVEEKGHDPKSAPADAVNATDKAGDAAPNASAPSAAGATAKHNTKKDPMPKTKAGMIKAAYDMMSSSKKDDVAKMVAAMYHQKKKDGEKINAGLGSSLGMPGVMQRSDMSDVIDNENTISEFNYRADFSEDLNALVESEATLSDEFKEKAETIFEAAIKSKLSEEIDRLEAKYNEELEEELATTKSELVEKVDSYLNYVVENWMEENKLAVQSGLRTEIAENFMNSLKDLFTESYIEVPESKVDLVDELATANEELEEKLNAQTGKSIEMAEELETYKREAVIREASKDLAETQIEKLNDLVKNIDFEDEETFTSKVATVKESYFNKKAVGTTELDGTEEDTDDLVEASGSMATYLSAIKRQNK